MTRKLLILLPVLLLGVALDQISKEMVLRSMPLGSHLTVIKGYFNLVHIHNRGAVFGLLSTWSLDFVRIFFIITTGIVLAVVGYLWWRLPENQGLAGLGYSLIMAGAVGNLVDRVRFGEVVDFLDFHWRSYHWPAFNVADSLLCLGAGVLVLVILREEKGVDVSSTA
ncbi:MAG: signal peptidase II [Deltaproteobacteria bacterium RBG_13_60_28]|nr:MAG: signal peptidase II [Deltaproteobacteria bacterium RBG_13_60_28]